MNIVIMVVSICKRHCHNDPFQSPAWSLNLSTCPRGFTSPDLFIENIAEISYLDPIEDDFTFEPPRESAGSVIAAPLLEDSNTLGINPRDFTGVSEKNLGVNTLTGRPTEVNELKGSIIINMSKSFSSLPGF